MNPLDKLDKLKQEAELQEDADTEFLENEQDKKKPKEKKDPTATEDNPLGNSIYY